MRSKTILDPLRYVLNFPSWAASDLTEKTKTIVIHTWIDTEKKELTRTNKGQDS